MVMHPLFGEVSKDFNEAEAQKVYDMFMEDPAYMRALLHTHAHEVVSEVKFTNPEIVDELVFAKYDQRKELVKEALINGVISKSMSDSTIDEISKAMEAISKYTEYERRLNASEQRRDPRGRFVPMGRTRIELPTPPRSGSSREWDSIRETYDAMAQQRVKQTPPRIEGSKLKDKRRSEFDAKHSAAYLQVAEALNQMDPGLIMADITYQRHNKGTGAPMGDPVTITRVGASTDDFVRTTDFEDGLVPTNIRWYADADSVRGGGFDLLTSAGMSGENYIAGVGLANRAPGAMKEYTTTMSGAADEYGASSGYRKLGAAAQMIDSIGGDQLSGQSKFALAAAKYVGDNGQEAEKILGPTARRQAYRYRGVERKPDPQLERAMLASVQTAQSTDDAREMLIHPRQVGQNVGGRYVDSTEFSPFIRYWQSQLPKREHLNLHLDSGAIAPSQGVIIDAKGQVVTQAVGYGDDHYLPFNPKTLAKSNRGEWIRTRTMGGPTTEDIYAALTTGTRSITVVSHSGVYNIEFDKSFRGGRRYNDKAARMVKRYSQLLDTLDANSTSLQDVPQDRRDEIELRVRREIPGESKAAVEARNAKIRDLTEAERKDPKPSNAQKEAWREEFVQTLVARQDKWDDNAKDGPDSISWSQIKARESIRAGRELDDDAVISALGQDEQYQRFMTNKTREYRTLQEPLKLNGQGYYFALQALQEQFPYYIKRVEWYPPNDQGGSIFGTDKGYVLRNFNRPRAAKEGYWATEIEGRSDTAITDKEGKPTGKVRADFTNYQNWANRQRINPTSPPSKEEKPSSDPEKRDGESAPTDSIPLGVPLNLNAQITNDQQIVARRRAAVVALAQKVANTSMEYIDEETGEKKVKRIGASGVGYPLLSKWDKTMERIQSDPKAIDELEAELDSLFGSEAAPSKNATAQRRKTAENSEYLAEYVSGVMGNRLKKPGYAGADVADEKSLFALGDEFMPGRDPDDYRLTAQQDDDVRTFIDTRPRPGDFASQVRAAESALVSMEGTSDPNIKVTYMGKTYGRLDAEELREQVRRDAIGYIKWRQLERLIGTAAPVEEEEEEPNNVVGFNPPPGPTPPGGASARLRSV